MSNLNNRLIDRANTANRDRAHSEFLVTWNAKFPNNEDI
jgi:hypothetical protein